MVNLLQCRESMRVEGEELDPTTYLRQVMGIVDQQVTCLNHGNLDGNLKEKMSFQKKKIRFVTARDLIKCLKHIK